MFRRIVVGADTSREGRDAVALAAAIATATGAGITLLQAYPTVPLMDGAAAERRCAGRQLASLRDELAPTAHIACVADGNAARALLAEAESWHADLIVIGSSRKAATGRCAIGGTGRRLLTKLPPALAIARRGLHEDTVTLANIAVGYDGGPESDRALRFADRLAVHANAELLIETVNKDPIPTLLSGESLSRELLAEIREGAQLGAVKIGERAASRTAAPCHVNGSIGDAALVLREMSEDADLMVIGSRRWGLLPRVLLGGVGEALAADCGASLVIASSPAEHASTVPPTTFADRRNAGRRLASRLSDYHFPEPVVVGVAPEAMPTAAEIAKALGAPLDTVAVAPLLPRPGSEDRFGVAAEGGTSFFDPQKRAWAEANPEAVDAALVGTHEHLERLTALWHGGPHRRSLKGRTVLLVAEALIDERLAAAAACSVLDRGAAHVVYVTPKARYAAAMALGEWVDEIVGLEMVDSDIEATDCFDEATPVTDNEVRALLRDKRNRPRKAQRPATRR